MSHTHHHSRDLALCDRNSPDEWQAFSVQALPERRRAGMMGRSHLCIDECEQSDRLFPSGVRYDAELAVDALSRLQTPVNKEKVDPAIDVEVTKLLGEIRLHHSALSQHKQMGVIFDLLRLGILKFKPIEELTYNLREGYFDGTSPSSVAFLLDAISGDVQDLTLDLKDRSFESVAGLAMVALTFLPKDQKICGTLLRELQQRSEGSSDNLPADCVYMMRDLRKIISQELVESADFQIAYTGSRYQDLSSVDRLRPWLKALTFLELPSSNWAAEIAEDCKTLIKRLPFSQMLELALELCQIGGATPKFLSFVQAEVESVCPRTLTDIANAAHILSYSSDLQQKESWHFLMSSAVQSCSRKQRQPTVSETKSLMEVVSSYLTALRAGAISSADTVGLGSVLQRLIGTIAAGTFKQQEVIIPTEVLLGYIKACGETFKVSPQPYAAAVETFLNAFKDSETNYGATFGALDVVRVLAKLRVCTTPIMSSLVDLGFESMQRGDLVIATKLVAALASIRESNPEVDDRGRVKELFSQLVPRISNSSSYWPARSAVFALVASSLLKQPLDPEVTTRFEHLSKSVSTQNRVSKFEKGVGSALASLGYTEMDLTSSNYISQALVVSPNLHGYFVDYMIVENGERIAIEAHGEHFHTVAYIDSLGRCFDTVVDGQTILKANYLKSRGIPTISIWSHHWNAMSQVEQREYLRNEIAWTYQSLPKLHDL